MTSGRPVAGGGELTFLPALRRGLIQAVTTTDDGRGGPIAGGPALNAWVEVEGSRAGTPVRLLGPESVTGVAAGQILRAEPRPDSSDVEPGYFPFVELATPDLPWMLTPAVADDRGRVRPWLVLVAVRVQDGVTIAARPGATLPVLSTPAGELPDLAESWAWAHVQSLVGMDGIAGALQAGSGEVVARLVCPRRLLPDSAWIACLVPAFEAGRLRGLGQAHPRGTDLVPAWNVTSPARVELPVYYSWRFTTGPAGDFEALCRRLKPDGEGADLGRHPMEVGRPGLMTAFPRPVVVDMSGSLQTPGVSSRPWNKQHRESFQTEIVALLNAGAARVRLDDGSPDPVVAPPFYGSAPSGAGTVPDDGWLREINDDPVRRAAAGLGAAVVRADQEALVAAAWERAGALAETTIALNRARLGAEIATSWTRRTAAMADADLLQFSAPLHAFLRAGATSVRARLAASRLPAGLVSAAYVRQTRPAGPLARRWPAVSASAGGRLSLDHVATSLAATKAVPRPADAPALAFAAYGSLAGASVGDATLSDAGGQPSLGGEASPSLTTAVGDLLHLPTDILTRRRGRRPAARTPNRAAASAADVSGLAGTIRTALDPMGSVRASLLDRIPGLGSILTGAAIPTSPRLTPVFEDPLSDDLIRLGAQWMLPGVERIARNRVRLVEGNTDFIGTFLVGANHEMARELIWGGYPVDTRGTFFRRFWNYVAQPRPTDIGELSGWRRRLSVAGNMAADDTGAGAAPTVIVVRGDLVRRYPGAHYFLQQARLDGGEATPDPDATGIEATFAGMLAPDTVFYGFDLGTAVVRGDRDNGSPGYFLTIEEQPGAPRLGLDQARKRDYTSLPADWNQLSWGHLVGSEAELDALTHARADSARLAEMPPLDGVTWGRNSAHLARACWQRPFRMYLHADTFV